MLVLPSRARSYSYDHVQVPRVRCIPALQSVCSLSRRAYIRTRRRARSTRRRSGGGLRVPAASPLRRRRSSTGGRSANACTRRPRRRTRSRKGSWPPSRSRRSGRGPEAARVLVRLALLDGCRVPGARVGRRRVRLIVGRVAAGSLLLAERVMHEPRVSGATQPHVRVSGGVVQRVYRARSGR